MMNTNWYKTAQNQTLKFDPKRLKNPNQPNQSDPKIRAFQQAFISLGLNGIIQASQSDIIILDSIQSEIRKKLRSFGVQVGF